MPKAQAPSAPVVVAVAVAFVMLVLLVIAWPFSLAATQLLAADLYAGRDPALRELLSRAKPLWTRMFTLGLIVYGSYLLWTVIPFLVAVSMTAGAASVSGFLLMLSLLIFAAYMVARLFINFLSGNRPARWERGRQPRLTGKQRSGPKRTDAPARKRPLDRGADPVAPVSPVANVAIELRWCYSDARGNKPEQAATMVQAATKNSGSAFRPDDAAQLSDARDSAVVAGGYFCRALS